MEEIKKNMKEANGKKVLVLVLASLFVIITYSFQVMAHCPLCTGATIAGVAITRSLGWDDSIVGVFVGGMIISTALWMNKIFQKKNIGGNNKLRLLSLIILTAVLTLITFYYAGLLGRGNEYRIFGVESILVGSFFGGIVTLGSFSFSNHLKNKNGGRTLFSYQTIIISLVALIINAVAFAVLV